MNYTNRDRLSEVLGVIELRHPQRTPVTFPRSTNYWIVGFWEAIVRRVASVMIQATGLKSGESADGTAASYCELHVSLPAVPDSAE